LLEQHFLKIVGTKEHRRATMNWDELDRPHLTGLHHLDDMFSDKEIRRTIVEIAPEKSPGPDGFIGIFYRVCWDIIKHDVVAMFHFVHSLNMGPLMKLNGAMLTLLPKKEVSELSGNFRPISLIHSFAKLVSKVLALRLAKQINQLVSQAQSASIKQRCIQDNFPYVRNLERAYHKKKIPVLLLKMDISKAFDSVSWEYLLEVLEHRGFPARWRN
jgi:hypothetical protein